MRILLDTNIIVHREASKIYNEDIGILFRWLDKIQAVKCIHPITIDEISTHKDEDVVRTMKTKIENYNLLKTISNESVEILYIRKSDKSNNDNNDTSLLNELYNKRVDFLITEDKAIHRKADILGISEKVFKIESFIEKMTIENPELTDYKILSVKKEYFGYVNLKDSFFDSFKDDYKEFEKWFLKKSDEECYICMNQDKVSAFLYLKIESKEENYENIYPPFISKRRLKIGTFKVTSTGHKLGERFLKIIFDNALKSKVEEIYVTIFDHREEQLRLISLIEEWGFKLWGFKNTINGKERVYVRNFSKISSDNLLESYPFIDRNNRVFIVPIYPQYHTELFPDSILNNESSFDFQESQPHRNAIRKVYISRSKFSDLKKGDIILFYRTGGRFKGVISTIGVVDSIVKNIENEEKFISLCRKRSVFSNEELKNHWNYYPNLRPFIVNFLYVASFPTPKVTLDRLIELGIIKSIEDVPRGFMKIEKDKFEKFLKESRADESYFIN